MMNKIKARFLGNYYRPKKKYEPGIDGSVYDINYICKTLTASVGGHPKILINDETNKDKGKQ